MRVLAAAVSALAVLAVAAGTAAAAPPSLPKLLLAPSQVGVGYLMLRRTDGNGLGTRTLDLCGTANYPSEKLRSGRIQVDYRSPNSRIGVSNEVVTYMSVAGAAQAMREVLQHAVTCPNRAISPGEQNLPPLTFTITVLRDSHLLKGYLAVRVRTTGTVQGKKVDSVTYGIYQRLGNVFSGVYSFVTGNTDAPGQLAFALHAAEQSARNLRRLQVPGGPTV